MSRFSAWITDHRLLLLLITVLGTFLRLWNLSAAQYLGDDGDFLQTAWDMVYQGKLQIAFPSSAGIASGPIGLYILGFPLAFSSSHAIYAAFVAALNALCVPLLYFIGRDAFSPRVGLLAALLAAVNPWLVIYGRRLWITAYVAPLACVFLWASVRALRLNGGKQWGVAGGGLAATVLVHLSGIPNAISLLVSMLVFHRTIHWRSAVVGAVIALLLMAPWIIGSLIPDLAKFSFSSLEPNGTFADSSIERATLLVTSVGYQSVTGQSARLLNATEWPFTWIDPLARALSVSGWIWLSWSAWSYRRRDPSRAAICFLLCLMAALPLVALARPIQTGAFRTLYPYYFLNTLPVQLLAIGLLIDRVARAKPVWSLTLAAPIVGSQLLLAVPFFLTQEEYFPLGDYGVPWKFTEELADHLVQLARTDSSFVLVGGEEQDHSQQRLLAQVMAREYDRVRTFDGRDGLMFRTDAPGLLLVTTNDEESATSFLLTELPNTQVLEQKLTGGPRWTRRVFRLPPSQLENWVAAHLDPLAPDVSNPVYERGSILSDLRGQQITLLWRMDADPPEPFLTKLRLLVGGTEIHREEHVAYPAGSWQPGDWHGSKMLNIFRLPGDLKLPPGTRGLISQQGILTGRTASSNVELRPRPE